MIEVERIAELSGHQNPVFTVENSQKNHIFFTAGNDKGVVEWSLKTMAFVKVMFPVKSSVYALHCPTFKPLLIVGERSGQVSIFDFIEQRTIAILSHHKLPVFDIKSIESKNELLVSSEDGSVSIWSLEDFKLLYQFEVSNQTARVIAIDPKEKYAAVGSKDSIIRIYNLNDYSLVCELKDHTMPITALQFSPNGVYLLSGSRDAQLKIWNTSDFSLHESIAAHLFSIYDIKYHPTEPYFATASRDKSIKIWSSDDFKLCKIISREKGFQSHAMSINKISWQFNSNYLISIGDDKLVMVWDVKFD